MFFTSYCRIDAIAISLISMDDSSLSYHREINEQCVRVCGTSDWPAPMNPQSLVCPAPKSCSSLVSWPWNHSITQCFPPIHIAEQLFIHFFMSCCKSFRIYPLTMHWLVSFIIQYLMRVCILLSRRSHRFSSSIFLPESFLALKKRFAVLFSNRVLYFCFWHKYCS